MKEATGEVSMTVVTLVAIAVIGAILAFMWPTIKTSISNLWGGVDDTAQRQCTSAGGNWNATTQTCN